MTALVTTPNGSDEWLGFCNPNATQEWSVYIVGYRPEFDEWVLRYVPTSRPAITNTRPGHVLAKAEELSYSFWGHQGEDIDVYEVLNNWHQLYC